MANDVSASGQYSMELKLRTFPAPPKPKRSVNRSGRNIADGVETPEDLALVDQWRAAHGYVINTFQIFFKRRIEKAGSGIEFAQRLKRRNTVLDKLRRKRPDGTRLMADVTSMHDFAGCRLIFDDISSLRKFREYIHSAASMANVHHKLRHDMEKYDYIESPKPSGYRGIHDVFQHFPRPHRRAGTNAEPWLGLLVEVQYRTRVQHAWATALEISDLIDNQRTKFDLAANERVIFFAMASEILARYHEGISRAFLNKNLHELCRDFAKLERKLNILHRLEALKQADEFNKIRKHNVLNIAWDNGFETKLEVKAFRTSTEAVNYATQLESDPSSFNAVYVRADNPAQVRSAYRNYFNDPVDFVRLVRSAMRNS
ncbi:(p)ppGpp synthetase [Sphingomonas sp. S-NIH.Pt3_0716]|nr:(p)ppGpp synthetase [Sphingomonas sp. S-NIH.Pt3_0716]